MRRARHNPDDKAVWLAIGGAALAVGIVYVFTRPSTAAAASSAAPAPAPLVPVMLPSQGMVFQQSPADVRITVGDGQTVVPMRVGQVLSVAPPSSANVWQWEQMQSVAVDAGLLTRDANVQNLGTQQDGTFHLSPTSVGSNTVTLSYSDGTGTAKYYTFTVVVTA